ncbi:MAG: hypothetical protein H0V66_11730 [Bdellovibrionales bacterium]|nr:hypothetical protein [Bdellovibrionales bacterium]
MKNSVQTKMAGGVAWFTGEEEEKINAYGLGLTGSKSSARYLYLNKIEVISLDDSLIEFLPEDELKLSKGSIMVLNPDGKVRLADKNGESIVIKEGMLYSSTDKGLISTPAKWQKSWIPEGDSYSVTFENNILTESFLLAPPMLAIDRFGTSCIGKLQPINGDAGDIAYSIRSGGRYLKLTGLEVILPTAASILEVGSTVNGISSVWREIQLPADCIKEVGKPSIENLTFFGISRQQFLVDASATHNVLVYFAVDTEAKLKITGPNLNRSADIQGEFKREYQLAPGTYSFKLTQDGKEFNRIIDVKLKPSFKIKDSIFIEE